MFLRSASDERRLEGHDATCTTARTETPSAAARKHADARLRAQRCPRWPLRRRWRPVACKSFLTSDLLASYLPSFPLFTPISNPEPTGRLKPPVDVSPRLSAPQAPERPNQVIARCHLGRQVADKPNLRPHQDCHVVVGVLRVAPDGPHLIPVQLGSLGEPVHVTGAPSVGYRSQSAGYGAYPTV